MAEAAAGVGAGRDFCREAWNGSALAKGWTGGWGARGAAGGFIERKRGNGRMVIYLTYLCLLRWFVSFLSFVSQI